MGIWEGNEGVFIDELTSLYGDWKRCLRRRCELDGSQGSSGQGGCGSCDHRRLIRGVHDY